MKNFWTKIKKPIIVAAPMSGITDEPFRLMLLKYGRPDVFWTEFVPVEGFFTKGKEYCLDTLKFSKKEKPVVAQVFGSNPESFKKVAELIEKLGFDGIDINMGCPDKNIGKTGAGADLIKNPKLAREIIRATKDGAKKIPVSVKTRIGYKSNEIQEWIPEILKENIAALTIHFRTKKQMYSPPTHWEYAKDILKLRDIYSPNTIILGNGDIKSLLEAKKISKETGLDGVMIGRAIIGNPWIFSGKDPTVKERLNIIVEHSDIFAKTEKHFDGVKKHLHAYAKNFSGARELRENLMKSKSADDIKRIVNEFIKNGNLK